MRDKYLKGKLVDPLAIEYGNFPNRVEGIVTQKNKESDWMKK